MERVRYWPKHLGPPLRSLRSRRNSRFPSKKPQRPSSNQCRLLRLHLIPSDRPRPRLAPSLRGAANLERGVDVRGPPVFLYSIHIYIYTTYLHLITSATASTTPDDTRRHSTALATTLPHYIIDIYFYVCASTCGLVLYSYGIFRGLLRY